MFSRACRSLQASTRDPGTQRDAAAEMAVAFLLDSRPCRLVLRPIEGFDAVTYSKVVELSSDRGWRSSRVLRVWLYMWIATNYLCEGQDTEAAEASIADGMAECKSLLKELEANPSLEDDMKDDERVPVLGGVLTQSRIHFFRYYFWKLSREWKRAEQELRAAIRTERKAYKRAEFRGTLLDFWQERAGEMSTNGQLFTMAGCVLDEAHPDQCVKSIALALRAICIERNSALGTRADARRYVRRLKSSLRTALPLYSDEVAKDAYVVEALRLFKPYELYFGWGEADRSHAVAIALCAVIVMVALKARGDGRVTEYEVLV